MASKSLKGIKFSPAVTEALLDIASRAKGGSSRTENEHADQLKLLADESEANSAIPLKAITLAKSIAATNKTISLLKLNESLKNTEIVYSQKQKSPAPSQAYAKRIQQLKLAEQERKYTSITKNLDKAPADDATIKSMLYAASIGANMIVAPLSIGVLMYFFAGKLFAFIVPDYKPEEGKIDIHGVIAGVIAGVAMLFIEMILFVIRNHEMDKFVTKKMNRHKNPFGYWVTIKRLQKEHFRGDAAHRKGGDVFSPQIMLNFFL